MARVIVVVLLTSLFLVTPQQPSQTKSPTPFPAQAKAAIPEKAAVFRASPAKDSRTPSQRKPRVQRLSDVEKRQIIERTTNVSPTSITPYLTLTTYRSEVQNQAYLMFEYPQWLDAGIAFYDGVLPGTDEQSCSSVFTSEGIDVYFYSQPNQQYLVDMIIGIPNGKRLFLITQGTDGQPGQSNDQGAGIANQSSISHVPSVVPACTAGCWQHLHYALEPKKDKSNGDNGPWIFAEFDISNYN
jgi:hypothetical protein